MITYFGDVGTRDIFLGDNTAAARQTCPSNIWPVARRKLRQLNRADQLLDLRFPQGNRLERLHGDLADWRSIRINEQWRIIFRWAGADAEGVEIVDYHRN